ncbi:MAG: toll/interleukin-1 receptor domain-containing protein [Lysinibacillus fusiformis]|uniref:toll/interleukin-1 receptor domain-containing protein n=1 Tax=Metasolibacillus sp. TaxID=2703680 RepID=UPI0025DDB6D0|nr:toll/interleukin-1 receptor domain-containing protein [Metasolibacillus sp.]MCT6818033.1 toll/interleukin-1 receptor domain-containing protein [Lysinibacillus fusiformis]MCT6924227.1 toll/interleukin-1 receptor domain-containing protein [Metasolibacillus sp.]MCT6940371.1 toll/interleukin-1 receptor domain-containing protein [Metasolibacillus sp.]
MGINETNLKRLTDKDIQLKKKLTDARKKRDSQADKLIKLSNKRNKTKMDIQKMGKYNKDLLKQDKDITLIVEQIRKNTEGMNRYKGRLAKEQEKQFKTMLKSMESQTSTNVEYLNSYSEMSKKLNELSLDIKHSVKEKEIIEFDVFLSHSSLDKEIFVSELSEKLSNKGLKVFEDVKVFKIGQSQTDMMNMGILNLRFVVIFLSKNFIESGWSQYEFKSFLNREINEKRVVILPIWHEVTVEEVRQYNPYIVDKYAINTSKHTLDEMVDQIHQVVQGSLE